MIGRVEGEKKIIVLNSGKELVVTKIPFDDALLLFKSFLKALKDLNFDINMNDEININLIKNVVCSFTCSSDLETSFNSCLQRCLYDGAKVTELTKESESFRKDYLEVFSDVVFEVVSPFLSSLHVVCEKGVSRVSAIGVLQ